MELDQFEGHTPGPLACVELMAFAAGFAVEDGDGRTVARIMKTHGAVPLPARANAALFAAAPDLLAEVRRLTAEADALRRERDELAAPERADGWKVVPVEPTPGMVDAADSVNWCDGDTRGSVVNMWCRMLAAAPERAERLSEIERWKRIAEHAQAVTTGGDDKGDYFEVPSHLIAALALALDEGPSAWGGRRSGRGG